MLKRIKQFFTRTKKAERLLIVETDDPFMAAIVGEVFRTGKPHIGSVDDNGNFEMKEVEAQDKEQSDGR